MSLKHLFCTTFLLLVLTGAVSAQTESDLTQMLNKALAEVEASRASLLAKDNVIALQERLIDQQKAVIDAQKAENAALQGLNDQLRAIKCNESEWQFRPLLFKLFVSKKKVCY